MSENFEPITAEPETVAPLSHRRILILMAVIAVFGGLLSFIFVSWQFGVGVLIGGILSFVNYYWLKFSLKKIFDNVTSGEKPRFLAARYFFRYVTLGVVLTIVFLTKVIPVVAVILGLASFALAITAEGFVRLFSSFFKKREI